MRPGSRIAFLNAPDDGAGLLDPLPEGAVLVTEVAGADIGLLFVRDVAELERAGGEVIPQFADDRPLWICYPKGGAGAGTDLGRDVIRDLVPRWGMDTVTLISLDERWSAMRIRPQERVGTR